MGAGARELAWPPQKRAGQFAACTGISLSLWPPEPLTAQWGLPGRVPRRAGKLKGQKSCSGPTETTLHDIPLGPVIRGLEPRPVN